MRLTETYLKSLKPTTTAYRVFEKGTTTGFGVRVYPSGLISFFVRYTDEGKAKFKVLGEFPTLTIPEARELAHQFKIDVKTIEVRSGSFKMLLDNYLSTLTSEGKRSTKEIDRIFNKDVFNVIPPNTPAKDVVPRDVSRVLFNLIERGAAPQSNRVRSYLRSAFQFGIKYDNDPRNLDKKILFNLVSNPVDAVPRDKNAEVVGERVLTLEELKFIWNYAGKGISQSQQLSLKLIIALGGLRSGEVTQMAITEIDFDQQTVNIPPSRSKNGKWHIIPMTDIVIDLLDMAIAIQGVETATHLFPHRFDKTKPESKTALHHGVVRLIRAENMELWSPRDLRRTCKTWQGFAGIGKEIRDRLQNHALNDVSSKHYDRHLYLKEKLEALKIWERFILENLAE
jgi:integrase